MTSNSRTVAVVGDGWSALAAVGFLASSGIEVKWISGSGARILIPLSSIEWGPGVHIWSALAQKLGIECGEPQSSVWIREFRNKAFREPHWAKAPTPAARLEVREETLWAPERHLVGVFESQWETMTPVELEEEMRKILLSGRFSNLSRIDGDPVIGFTKKNDEICGVRLGSGQEIECSQAIYADKWGLIPALEGLPKALSFLRKREPMGVLQASFSHELTLSSGHLHSFFAPLHRAAGDEVERHVWGHFSSDAKRSVWTLCLSPEEIEDNREIAKKLRRLKSTLDRMFQGSDLIPEGKSDFGATIIDEQVRFEDEAFFADGIPLEEPATVPGVSGLLFLTDGYGPSRAFQQVGTMLGVEKDAENKSVDTETEEQDRQSQ